MQGAIPQSSDSLAPLAAEKSVLELYLFAILCYLHILRVATRSSTAFAKSGRGDCSCSRNRAAQRRKSSYMYR